MDQAKIKDDKCERLRGRRKINMRQKRAKGI